MKSPTRGKNILLYASPEFNADIFYVSKFSCPDAFIFIRTARGRRICIMSDLEIDRARATSNAHRVLSMSHYVALTKKKKRNPAMGDIITTILRDLNIRSVSVPSNFELALGDTLRKNNIGIKTIPAPFFPERVIKSEKEIAYIRDAMRATEKGMQAALDLLRASRIRKGWVMYEGKRLTAERLRQEANREIFERGYIPAYTIVAPGVQGCDPHEAGSGPIRANEPIIIDIFPRSEKTGYFGDMTRTFVKGKASQNVRHLFDTVAAGQKFALKLIRDGINARIVHDGIHELFAQRGYKTGMIDGRMQGFFHGTGHGLGLEIHEGPRIGAADVKLKKGMVVTVEPGLYYAGTGGVRIEDTVLVTGDGVRNLTRFPKFLEVD